MYKDILRLIDAHERIIIHRHKTPDLDALGAQAGLKRLIEDNFEAKTVKMVGDENTFRFLARMDEVEDAFYDGALAIVVDVAVSRLVADERYTRAQTTLVIDHHRNDTDFADFCFSYPEHIATCQLLGDMAMRHGLKVSPDTATYLLGGIITDSGRFLYPAVNATTFRVSAFLMEQGADLPYLYENLYTEDLKFKKLKGHFINHFKTTKASVAYMKNTKDLKTMFNVDTFTISRGMVNQMGGIAGIPMWVNFTEDDDGSILCELRSKAIPIVDIAKKYGGGGHDLACGCTLDTWDDADKILNDLDTRVNEGGQHHG